MDEYTRPATWEDVLTVARLLKKYDVKFILVGGYALMSHGYTRMTMDLDISVEPASANSKKWILALSELPDGVTKELIGEDDPFDGDYQHAIRINDEITIDIMPSVSGVDFQTLENYIDYLKVDDVELPILNLEGLALTKGRSLRPKDISDMEIIKKMIENKININSQDDDDGPRM